MGCPDETRTEIVDRYRAACAHADATIDALDLRRSGICAMVAEAERDAVQRIVHVLTETTRHAGHAADILREQIDGQLEEQRGHRRFQQKGCGFLDGPPDQNRE